MQKRKILLKHVKGLFVKISKRASSKEGCGYQVLANFKFGKGASHGTLLLQFLGLNGYCMPVAALMLAFLNKNKNKNKLQREESILS